MSNKAETRSLYENRLSVVPRNSVLNWFRQTVADMRSDYDFETNVREIVGGHGVGKSTALQMVAQACNEIDVKFAYLDFSKRKAGYLPEDVVALLTAPSMGLGEAGAQIKAKSQLVTLPPDHSVPGTQTAIVPRYEEVVSLAELSDELSEEIRQGPKNEPKVILIDRIDHLDDGYRKIFEGGFLGPLISEGRLIVVATAGSPQHWAYTDNELIKRKSPLKREDLINSRSGTIPVDNFTLDEMHESLQKVAPSLSEASLRYLHFVTLGHPMMVNMIANFFQGKGMDLNDENLRKHLRPMIEFLREEFVDGYFLDNDAYLDGAVYHLAGGYRFTPEMVHPLIRITSSMANFNEDQASKIYMKMIEVDGLVIEGRKSGGVYIDPAVAQVIRLHQTINYPQHIHQTLFENFYRLNREEIERQLGREATEGKPAIVGNVYHANYLTVQRFILNTLIQAKVFNDFSALTAAPKHIDPVKVFLDFLDTYLVKKNEFTIYIYERLYEDLQKPEFVSLMGEEVVEKLLKAYADRAEKMIKRKKK